MGAGGTGRIRDGEIDAHAIVLLFKYVARTARSVPGKSQKVMLKSSDMQQRNPGVRGIGRVVLQPIDSRYAFFTCFHLRAQSRKFL